MLPREIQASSTIPGSWYVGGESRGRSDTSTEVLVAVIVAPTVGS